LLDWYFGRLESLAERSSVYESQCTRVRNENKYPSPKDKSRIPFVDFSEVGVGATKLSLINS
jgi:hypothetical protein